MAFSRTPRARGKYFAVSHDSGDTRWDLGRLETLRAGFADGTWEGFRWRIELDEECLRRDPDITPARQWLERLKGGGLVEGPGGAMPTG